MDEPLVVTCDLLAFPMHSKALNCADEPRSLARSLCLRAVLSYHNGGLYEACVSERVRRR